jgi:hypothetical protein
MHDQSSRPPWSLQVFLHGTGNLQPTFQAPAVTLPSAVSLLAPCNKILLSARAGYDAGYSRDLRMIKRPVIVSLPISRICQCLKYEQLIPAMEKALSASFADRVIQPVRNMLTRFLGIMPAVAEERMGAKLVCFFPKSAGSKVPTHLAMIILFEPESGQPLAFLDSSLKCEPLPSQPRRRDISRQRTPAC